MKMLTLFAFFAIAAIFATTAIVSAASRQELTLQEVLKANTAAIQAIRSLHVTIEVSNNLPVLGEEKPPTEAQSTYTIEWYKDGDHERVRKHWLRGRGPHNSDAYNGPKGFKLLQNYDPSFMPSLSESISYPAVAETDVTRMHGADGTAPHSLSYMVLFDTKLEEYVAKHPSSKLVATPATSKLGCYEIITVEEKHTVPASDDVKELRIFVDPKVGFWIRRIEGGPWQKSTDPGDKGTGMMEVQEFRDCGNGLFWPLRSTTTVRLPGAKDGLDIIVRHTLHSINQPLPDEDFEIHFPDWLRIFDRPSGKVIIWGPDNKPRMTFASLGEYKEWYRPREKDPFQETQSLPQQTRLSWLIGVCSVVGLLLFSLIFWRRKAARVIGRTPSSAEKTQGDASVLP